MRKGLKAWTMKENWAQDRKNWEHSAIHATVNREKIGKGEKEGNKSSPPELICCTLSGSNSSLLRKLWSLFNDTLAYKHNTNMLAMREVSVV